MSASQQLKREQEWNMKNSTIRGQVTDGMLTRMAFVFIAIVIAGCISQAAAQAKQTPPAHRAASAWKSQRADAD